MKYVNFYEPCGPLNVTVRRVREDIVPMFMEASKDQKDRFCHSILSVSITKSLDGDVLEELKRTFEGSID